MKRILTAILLASVLSATSAMSQTRPTSLVDSASYAIGMNYAIAQLKPMIAKVSESGFDVNPTMIAAAINDVLMGRSVAMPDSIAQATLVSYQAALLSKISTTNLQKGEQFLAENSKRDGIKGTKSGLQYMVSQQGSGASPKLNDSVTVRYSGMLLDGTVFDKTPEGEVTGFPLDNLIPGWIEALQLMKEGSVWRIFLPARLAYGEKGAGATIGPNEVLVFDIELVKVSAR